MLHLICSFHIKWPYKVAKWCGVLHKWSFQISIDRKHGCRCAITPIDFLGRNGSRMGLTSQYFAKMHNPFGQDHRIGFKVKSYWIFHGIHMSHLNYFIFIHMHKHFVLRLNGYSFNYIDLEKIVEPYWIFHHISHI